MSRRDAWLRRLAGDGGPGRGPGRGRRVAVAVGLGWLVLMTIWGIGRSGFAEHADLFLVAGAVSGVAVVLVRLRPGGPTVRPSDDRAGNADRT